MSNLTSPSEVGRVDKRSVREKDGAALGGAAAMRSD